MLFRGSAIILVLVGIRCFAEDSPHWRGANRDGIFSEKELLSAWPEDGPVRVWTVEGIGEGYSSVAVSNGVIYTTGKRPDTQHGRLSAFELTGKLKWEVDYGPEWNDMQPGTHCCPTVDGNQIYVLSGLGKLVCRDVSAGAEIWSVDIASRFGGTAPRCGFAESLLTDGDRLICTPGGTDASLVALNKMTGQTIWTSKGLSEQSAYCSPILIRRGGLRLIVTITARHVVGVDADSGNVVWKESFDPTAQDPNHSVAPAYENGLVYVTSGHRDGGCMFTLSPDGKSVTLKWTDKELNCLHGGVIMTGGYVYGSSSTGRWICLRASDGQLMYKASGVGLGSIISDDGMLYCYGEKGTLGLVKATAERFEMVSSFKIAPGKGPHWAHPVISGGRLYIRHGDTLSAFDIRRK